MKTMPWLLLVLLLGACGGKEPAPESAPPTPSANDAFVAEARAATNRLQIELKQALSTAMQEGGAVAALEVCSLRAPEIGAEVTAQTGLRVTRVSERNRNPRNVPTEGQRAVLRAFEAEPAIADTVIVDAGEATYLRPIRIGVDLCLQCHGPSDALAADLTAKLAQLYPEDQATGFAMGDLRGAFVVQRAHEESE